MQPLTTKKVGRFESEIITDIANYAAGQVGIAGIAGNYKEWGGRFPGECVGAWQRLDWFGFRFDFRRVSFLSTESFRLICMQLTMPVEICTRSLCRRFRIHQ